MNFVDFGEGEVFNLDHVRSVNLHWRNKSITLNFIDGTSKRIGGEYALHRAEELRDLAAPAVIPAAPGFEMLRCWFDEEHEPDIEREPIIAWRIVRDYRFAITVDDGPSVRMGTEAILCPDGSVTDIGTCKWKDAGAWTEYVHEKWKEWCAEKKNEALSLVS